MARIEYLRHKTQTAVPDDGTSDVGSDEWNGDAHAQTGLIGFDDAIKTIATGAFVIANTLEPVAAESGVTDDLDTITATDAQTNDIAIIKPDTGDTITVKHNTGNIQLPGGQDIVLDAANKPYLILIYDGTNWKIPNCIGNALVDDNNNEIIKFGKTASAVNEVTVTNAATTTDPKISATGGDANIGLTVSGKGTGKVKVADGSDNTKLAEWDLSGATTAKKVTLKSSHTDDRTITYPDATGTLGLTTIGTHDLPVLAGSMYATTNEPATGLTLTNFATNDIDEYTWDFTSTSADESVQFKIPAMPRNWDEGAITVEITWSFASGSGDVVWRVGAVAQGDNDAIDAAFTYCADKVDTAGTANQIQKVVTASFTPAGSPAAGDALHFEVQRQGSDAADTFSGTARLHGVTIRLTTDAATAA